MDLSYIKSIHGGFDIQDSEVSDVAFEEEFIEAKDLLRSEMLESDALCRSSKRNGEKQRFLFSGTKSKYKFNIVALPYEELYGGDVIDYSNEKWIVTELITGNRYTKSGVMWLCNMTLRFQNGTSKIIETPAVLDSGVYSTTLTGDEQVKELGKQFKLYLPYNDDTKKIYVDKRIAVDTRYDSHGNEILEVYKVTGLNKVARSYGTGSHLLICELKSDLYSPKDDSLEDMVCDFIPESETPTREVEDISANILGFKKSKIGTKKTYRCEFKNSQGDIVEYTPVWEIFGDADVAHFIDGKKFVIDVADIESNIGTSYIVKVKALEDSSISSSLTAEVV